VAGHQLIGAPVSLYTGKARAYLRYKGIPFEEVLATREVYRDVIIPRTGVQFIPVLISDDDVAVQDTTDIIDFLESRHPEPSVYPETPLQRLVALLFEVYGDEWLVIPAMHYRWSFDENVAFCYDEFGSMLAPEASADEQRRQGEKAAAPFAGALEPLGITERSAPAVERSYLAFLRDFDAHLAEHSFLLGERPSIGDFGLMGPLYAHLYRDPYSGRVMREHAPRVAEWVERMNDPRPRSGAFLPEDRIPATVKPMLGRMFAEQAPVILDTARQVAEWAREAEQRELPRAVGMHEYTIEGVTENRAVFPFSLWMWQRPLDHYRTLTGETGERARALLRELGGEQALAADLPQRVRREDNRLVLA